MTWLVEHHADGRVRLAQRIGECPDIAARFAVVDDIPRSVERTAWFSTAAGCFECGLAWAAIGPEATPLNRLECVRCEARRSGIPVDEWCFGCGASYSALREDGCPDPAQCAKCGEWKATAA